MSKEMFTASEIKEIESHLSKVGESLCEIVSILREKGISPKSLQWLNEINTASSQNVEHLSEYLSDNTFEDWKKKQEIYSDETVTLLILLESGETVKESATFNFATGLISCDSGNMSRDDISRIFFLYNGDEMDVCLDCGEGVIMDHCMNCGE